MKRIIAKLKVAVLVALAMMAMAIPAFASIGSRG